MFSGDRQKGCIGNGWGNPSHATDLFQYSMKASESEMFSDAFMGYI